MTQKTTGLIETRDNLFDTYREQLDLSEEVLDRADELLDKAVDAGLTRSRCYKTIISAVTLLACREQNIPRVSEDFSQHTIKDGEPLPATDISKESRKLRREFTLSITPTDASQYLDYYATKLNLNSDTITQSQRLLSIAEQNGLATGPAPTTMAAACIDAARRLTDEDIYQTDIADVSHVSESQIRKRSQMLMEGPTA